MGMAVSFTASFSSLESSMLFKGDVRIATKSPTIKAQATDNILKEIFSSFKMTGKNKKLKNKNPIDGCGSAIPKKYIAKSDKKK
jgi:hypothetical protein